MSQRQPPNGYLSGDQDVVASRAAHLDCKGTQGQAEAGGTECGVQVQYILSDEREREREKNGFVFHCLT